MDFLGPLSRSEDNGRDADVECGFEIKCFMELDFHFTVPNLSK